MLTRSKEEVAHRAFSAAKNAIQTHAAVGWNNQPGSMMGQLTDLIAKAVEAGVREALDAIYTNEDFNKDIGL